jgi:hypothetical protein
VQECLADGSRFGSCFGCPDEGPSTGSGGSEAGSGGGASGSGGSEATPVDPLGCVETDLGELTQVSRDVVGPATLVYLWQPPVTAVYRLDGTDGTDTPLLSVRRTDCNGAVAQELSGRAPILAQLEGGVPLVIAVTWESDTATTLLISEYEQATCTGGQVDCGSGCVTLANSDVDCGCNVTICASQQGKKTECVATTTAPYGACTLLSPTECDSGLVLCNDGCYTSPPQGYGVCPGGACLDITAVEHCGSACSSCRSVIGGTDPVQCVPNAGDYECRAAVSCQSDELDCGSGCVTVLGEACGCNPVCCATWTGAMSCAIEGSDAVCRSTATNQVASLDRQMCVDRGTLPP